MNPVNDDELAAEKSETIYTTATVEVVKIHYGCGCTGYRVHLDGRPKPSELAKAYGMIPDTHPLAVTELVDVDVVQQHCENEEDCQATADAA